MNVRSLTLGAAVILALGGLTGCNRDSDNINQPATPDTTTTAPTTPPAAPDTTATTPPATAPAPAPAPGTDADRSAGQTVDDAGITAKVKAALLAESGVDGTKINVDTMNGLVTLKGEVPNQGQIDKAMQITKGIEGVKEVDNRLTLAPS
jgi:hyperosmotically inducible protein